MLADCKWLESLETRDDDPSGCLATLLTIMRIELDMRGFRSAVDEFPNVPHAVPDQPGPVDHVSGSRR